MAATAIPVCSGRSRKRSEEHDDAHEADPEADRRSAPASVGVGPDGSDGDAGDGIGADPAEWRLGGSRIRRRDGQLLRQHDDGHPDDQGRDHQLGQLQHRQRLRSDLRPAVRQHQRHPQPRGRIRLRLRAESFQHRWNAHLQRHGVPDQHRRHHVQWWRNDQCGWVDRHHRRHVEHRLRCGRGRQHLRLRYRREQRGRRELCPDQRRGGRYGGLPRPEHHQLR